MGLVILKPGQIVELEVVVILRVILIDRYIRNMQIDVISMI